MRDLAQDRIRIPLFQGFKLPDSSRRRRRGLSGSGKVEDYRQALSTGTSRFFGPQKDRRPVVDRARAFRTDFHALSGSGGYYR